MTTNRSTFVTGRVAAFELEEDALAAAGDGDTDGVVQDVPLSFFTAVELKVFKTFVRNYLASGKLSDDDIIALDSVFGPTIQQVFEMLEEEQVFIRQGLLTERVLIEVCGKKTYWIPPGHSVCQCMFYKHRNKEFCKHILAAQLCLAVTPKENYKEIDDEQLTQIYKEFLANN